MTGLAAVRTMASLSVVATSLVAPLACEDGITRPVRLPATHVVIVASSCQGLDLCGQCPIEVLILDKNSNPTLGTIAWTTSDPSIGVINEFGRFHGFRQGSVTVRAEVVEDGVFNEAMFEVPDCSGGVVARDLRRDRPYLVI